MYKKLLCAVLAAAALTAPAAPKKSAAAPQVPQVWKNKSDAGRFTRLTTFPADWQAYRRKLRDTMWKLLGTVYDPALPLDCQEINSFQHEGITLKNVIYQTRPGIYTTATVYLPPGKGPFPAVLNMQGHWATGRLAERVQQRGFAFAKSGYVVLSPDTFGQGERSNVHNVFIYHGRDLGAQFYHIGETLTGALLVDNMRGIDLLCSMPEVDKERIGATGASGGGNQTMYLAAMDDRVKAAMPVCSTGTYESYLTGVNCICETIPGGLLETEMAGILAMTAPRALLICVGASDKKVFSPGEMRRSFNAAMTIYKKLGAAKNFANRVFNHGHIYSPEAISAGLGWFDLHLKGIGDGTSAKVPEFTTLPEKKLMAFAPGKRPEKVTSIAGYVRKKGLELQAGNNAAGNRSREEVRRGLAGILKFSGADTVTGAVEISPLKGWKRFQLCLNDSKYLPLVLRGGKGDVVLVAHYKDKQSIPPETLKKYLDAGTVVAAVDLSHQGENGTKWPEKVMAYHQSARNALWLGRTLAGIWTSELIAVKDFLRQRYPGRKITLHGFREMAMPVLAASIFSDGISRVVMEEAPVSYLFEKYTKFYNIAFFIPNILCWGDMPLAAALSPAELVWISPRNQDGSPAAVPEKEIREAKAKLR